MLSRVIILSGGFDPLHEGHIALFEDAKANYDYVVVGLNSDDWLTSKKGKPFMDYITRGLILKSVKYIDKVLSFNDDDGTAIDLLKTCKQQFTNCSLTFGNGGDRSNKNYPEYKFCLENNINLDDSLGGTYKMKSSSSILASWKSDSTISDWGMWKVLQQYSPNTTKIEELVVNPKESLSWQMHHNRAEIWHVREGTATVHLSDYPDKDIQKIALNKHDVLQIPLAKWHRLSNETKEILSIIEIQYGSDCSESDIVRKPFPGLFHKR